MAGASSSSSAGDPGWDAAEELEQLQDDLPWEYVTGKWRILAKKWLAALDKLRGAVEVDTITLWTLVLQLEECIKNKALRSEWTQARIEWLETPQANAEAVLRAVRVLRAHTLHLEGGPIYGLTGSPLPAEGEASGAPACDPAGPTKEATNVPAGSRKGASAPNLCGNLGCPLVLGHSGLCAIEGQFGRRSVATNGAATCAPVGNPLPAAPAPARAPSRAAASPGPRPSPPPMEQPPPRQQPAPKPPPPQRPPPKVQPPQRTPPPPRPQPQQPSPPPDPPQPEREPVPQEQARGGSPPRCAGCVAAAPADCVASAAATAGGPARGQDLSGACGGPSTPAQAAVPDSRPTAAAADLEPSRDPPVSSEHDKKWTQEQTRAALGWRVSVYWAGNRQWFEGEIVRVSASGANRCMVLYDVDKQRKWHRLWEDEFVWLGRAGGRALSGPGRPGAPSPPAAQASAEEASPSDDSEDDVPLTMRAQQRGGVVRPPASGGLPGPAAASPDGAMQSHAVPSSSGAAPPDLEAARQLLADLEDRIPFVHVSRAFAREVRKWRVGLDDAATPTEVAKKLVTLRAHMLEESAAGESLIREDWRRGSGRYVEWKREAQHGPMDLTTLVRLISELDASRASAHDIGVDNAASAADQRARRQVRSPDAEEAVPKRSAPPAQPASSPKRRRLRNKPSTPLAGKKPPAPSQQKRPWRAAQAQASVGWRVRVWWEGDQCFYNGRIGKYRPGTAAVKVYYDDGWRKWYLLWEENFVWKAGPDSSPAPARSQQRDRHRATVAEADAVTSTSASQAAEGSSAQNYRPCGRKTGPPSFFTPSPSRCNCSQSDRTNKQCADPCCANYDYYDAMKLTSGGKVIRLNDGLRILPQEGTKEPFLVAMFGGVRVSREDGRVEFVARYFCRAVDSYVQQEFAWHQSPFFGWSPRPPASCVYRLIDDGGNWISEWDTVSAVMSKCTVVQVTRRQLREFCNRSAGKPADKLTEFFYAHTWSAFTGAEPQLIGTGRLSDDESSSSDDEDEQPLRVRRKGREAAAAKSSAPMDASLGPSAGRYRIKRSSKPAQPGDAVVEEVPCKEHEIHESLCAVCHADDRRELLVCKGGCLRVFHLECAGITTGDDREMLHRLHQENGWQCSDCRAGKLACFVCKKMGTLNSEVFRCGFRVGGVPACGKVYHPECVKGVDQPGFECPLHNCAMCSRRSVRLVRCICCTRSFCNKDACLPAKHRRLGTSSLVCDTSRPHHDLDALVQRHQPTPLESARLGAELVHLIQPEAGDAFAGVFYQAGLGQRCSTEGRAPIGGGEGAESEFFGADERLSMDVLRTLPSCDASDEARARMAKRPRQQLSIASTVLPARGPTVPERLRGGGRSALMTASVVPAHGGDERVEVRMVDAQTELYTCPRRAAFPTLQTPDHRVTEKIWRAVSTSSKPDSAGRDSVVSQIVQNGVALDAERAVKVNSETLRVRRRATKEEMDGLRSLPAGQQPTIEKAKGLLSRQRFYLNGLAFNRAKFTTYSRHYTTHTVLCKIAAVVQPLLRPGDTFVDFSCGQNTFAPLLMDPANGRDRLRSVAVDIISPVERTDGFVCKSWLLVDPTHLPPGELVIGVNPPFGHENRKAIEFVEHARCAQPRLLVLIFPATNYHPNGYELVHRDEHMCRGAVFYAPGSASSNMINAHHVSPTLLVYRRLAPVAGPRCFHCLHVQKELKLQRQAVKERYMGNAVAKKRAAR